MIMYNIVNMFLFFSEEKGFGINTDVFETNILNLSVVIGILVYYGRVAFSTRFIYKYNIYLFLIFFRFQTVNN